MKKCATANYQQLSLREIKPATSRLIFLNIYRGYPCDRFVTNYRPQFMHRNLRQSGLELSRNTAFLRRRLLSTHHLAGAEEPRVLFWVGKKRGNQSDPGELLERQVRPRVSFLGPADPPASYREQGRGLPTGRQQHIHPEEVAGPGPVRERREPYRLIFGESHTPKMGWRRQMSRSSRLTRV